MLVVREPIQTIGIELYQFKGTLFYVSSSIVF